MVWRGTRPGERFGRRAAGICGLATALWISVCAGADTELAAAAGLVDRGDYTMAITRLSALIEKRPNSDAANEARYHLGRAYEGIGSHGQALEQYAEYLLRAPGGAHESEALAGFRRSHEAHEAAFPSAQTLEQQTTELRARLESNPDDTGAGLALAANLWRLERYEEAGEVYRELHAHDPAVANDPGFKSRIEIAPGGEWMLLTPDVQARRAVSSRPVSVFNTHAYRGGRERFTQKARWYIVTGEVINRSDRPVTNVQVQTTIYSFGTTIQDTYTQRIGRLEPGQSRPFTARFRQFEDINNIARYECIVTHD